VKPSESKFVIFILLTVILVSTQTVYASHIVGQPFIILGDPDGAPEFEVTFLGKTLVAGDSKFSYEVKVITAGPPALSHITFGLAGICYQNFATDGSDFVSFAPPVGGDIMEVVFGNDPTLGFFGLKWGDEMGVDFGETVDEMRMYMFTVPGDVPEVNESVGIKAGGPTSGFESIGMLPGPGCVTVGGTSVPIDTTALLLAGSQMTVSWMIPVIVAGIGIAIVIARKL